MKINPSLLNSSDLLDLIGIKYINGTVTKTVTGDSVRLFTLSQLQTEFDLDETPSKYHIYAIVNNGDGDAMSKHFESCTWTSSGLYVVWNGSITSQSLRINYLIFYIP